MRYLGSMQQRAIFLAITFTNHNYHNYHHNYHNYLFANVPRSVLRFVAL